MTCQFGTIANAQWVLEGASTVIDGALEIDPSDVSLITGHEYLPDEELVSLFTWELIDLGSAPVSLGVWFDGGDGIFYRTDGVVVIGEDERGTLAAQPGDVVKMYLDAYNDVVVFMLNGVQL